MSEQRTSKQNIAEQLREAVPVLDEPFHREAISVTLYEAADEIERLGRENARLLDHIAKMGNLPPAAWRDLLRAAVETLARHSPDCRLLNTTEGACDCTSETPDGEQK
jgi:hypothetical protein